METTQKDLFEMVIEFHQVFNHPISQVPVIPSDERISFRHNFIKEELLEMITASIKKDKVELADGLCDIMYVLGGYIIEAGLQDKFSLLMQEVHASNMSKSCISQEEAEQTIHAISDEQGPCYFEKVGEKFIVKRSKDDKVMKSINYFKPDLAKIINS